jgi:hypothetical protein
MCQFVASQDLSSINPAVGRIAHLVALASQPACRGSHQVLWKCSLEPASVSKKYCQLLPHKESCTYQEKNLLKQLKYHLVVTAPSRGIKTAVLHDSEIDVQTVALVKARVASVT